jgi:hypothetical protein
MAMVRQFSSVVVVSLLLLYDALFSLSSHDLHLHGGLVLDHFHGDPLGLGVLVLGVLGAMRVALPAFCFARLIPQTHP